MGLPGPQHLLGPVVVAVPDESAGGADRCAHAEALLHARATPATLLAGILRRDRHHLPTGAGCLGGKDGPKRRPARIADACRQAVIPYQVGDPQVFQRTRVVLLDQPACGLVVAGAPLPSHLLLVCGDQPPRLPAARAPLLPPGQALLSVGQPLLRLAGGTRVLDLLPRCGDQQDREASVDAGLGARWREWLCGHLRTGEGDIPTVGLT